MTRLSQSVRTTMSGAEQGAEGESDPSCQPTHFYLFPLPAPHSGLYLHLIQEVFFISNAFSEIWVPEKLLLNIVKMEVNRIKELKSKYQVNCSLKIEKLSLGISNSGLSAKKNFF